MSLAELELAVARDFCASLRELVAIYAERLSPEAQRLQAALEMTRGAPELELEAFREARGIIHAAREAIAKRDVPGLKARAAQEITRLRDTVWMKAAATSETKLLNEAIELWEKAGKRDKKQSFEAADKMAADVKEWRELGGEL